jgi:hypothetical protein
LKKNEEAAVIIGAALRRPSARRRLTRRIQRRVFTGLNSVLFGGRVFFGDVAPAHQPGMLELGALHAVQRFLGTMRFFVYLAAVCKLPRSAMSSCSGPVSFVFFLPMRHIL